MRPSRRTEILRAALRVAEQEGITELTLEGIALEAGVTKQGLIYHFPSREALLEAVHQLFADDLTDALEKRAGKPAAEASAIERLEAYVHAASGNPATPAELAFLAELPRITTGEPPWSTVLAEWVQLPQDVLDADVDLLLARLAADGLWVIESLLGQQVDPQIRRAVTARIIELIRRAREDHHPDNR